jgi:hypothetical protein
MEVGNGRMTVEAGVTGVSVGCFVEVELGVGDRACVGSGVLGKVGAGVKDGGACVWVMESKAIEEGASVSTASKWLEVFLHPVSKMPHKTPKMIP